VRRLIQKTQVGKVSANQCSRTAQTFQGLKVKKKKNKNSKNSGAETNKLSKPYIPTQKRPPCVHTMPKRNYLLRLVSTNV